MQTKTLHIFLLIIVKKEKTQDFLKGDSIATDEMSSSSYD